MHLTSETEVTLFESQIWSDEPSERLVREPFRPIFWSEVLVNYEGDRGIQTIV